MVFQEVKFPPIWRGCSEHYLSLAASVRACLRWTFEHWERWSQGRRGWRPVTQASLWKKMPFGCIDDEIGDSMTDGSESSELGDERRMAPGKMEGNEWCSWYVPLFRLNPARPAHFGHHPRPPSPNSPTPSLFLLSPLPSPRPRSTLATWTRGLMVNLIKWSSERNHLHLHWNRSRSSTSLRVHLPSFATSCGFPSSLSMRSNTPRPHPNTSSRDPYDLQCTRKNPEANW